MSQFLAMDKLPSWVPIHHFNEPVYNYKTGPEVVDFSKKSLWAFVGMVAFNPIFWNIVARNEYRNKTITKIVGSPYVGCYILALTIFSLSGFRDTLFLDALKNQPSLAILSHNLVKPLAIAFFAAGQIFVLSSMWALGVTGTYLGDYFGILMTHRVTGFPFNVLNDPMYIGSFLTHIGTALWYKSPAGILLSFWILVVYLIALRYEGPFTDMIYSAAHKKSESSKRSSTSSSGKSSSISTSTSTSTSASSKPAGSAPSTPRKSSRTKTATGSYADAAAEEPASDNEVIDVKPKTPKGAATPRRSGRISTVTREELAGNGGSPMRMTRSRSKGRGLGGSETDD